MPRSQRGAEPLSLWKHVEPSDTLSDDVRDRLLAALHAAAQTSNRSEVQEAAALAASSDLRAMVALALDYAAHEQDDDRDFELSIGWLLLAASSSALARFAIGWFLARRAGALRREILRGQADEGARSRVELLDRQAWKWLSDSIAEYYSLENLVGRLPTLATLRRKRADDTAGTRQIAVEHSPVPSAAAAAASPAPETVPRHRTLAAGRHAFRVLEPIPPAYGDPRLEAIIARFTKLSGPVPTAPLPDIDRLTAQLRVEFPWADRAIAWIEATLRLAAHVGAPCFALRPILLTGPPGSGKTRFVRRLAELTSTAFGTVCAAGSSDNRTLSGTARGWASTYPALPLVLIQAHFCANPVVLVDEIDKTSGQSSNGRILDSLLQLLEPETARRWIDECLLCAADLSAVTWICTANRTTDLPGPLLSRLAVLPFGVPRDDDFPRIVAAIRDDLAQEYHCAALALPELPQTMLEELRTAFGHHRDLRILRRLIITALARATRDKPVTH